MEHLTPKQVARAIGVSDASLKRWCDKGLIPSQRTAGGHRRLPLSGVIRFIRETGRPVVRPDILGLPPTTGTGRTVADRAAEQMVQTLEQGDELKFQRIVFDLYLAGHSTADICDNIIAPSFAAIGEHWRRHEIEVYQERRACEICKCTLRHLGYLLPDPGPGAPLAFGGTPETDTYAIPTTMAAAALKEAGWRAESFGTNLPLSTLIAAVRELHPRLVWLSVSWVADDERFLCAYDELYREASSCGVAVAVGGRRLDDPMRSRMRYSTYCDALGRLISFVRTLAPTQTNAKAR